MTALHRILKETRVAIFVGSTLLIVILLIPIFFGLFSYFKNLFFPTPLPPPKVEFGKLPEIKFPSSIDKKFIYSIDTIAGTLPQFPDRLSVYAITQEKPTLFALSRASGKAAHIGFTEKETALSETLYQWTDPSPPIRQLELDIVSSHFDVTSDFMTDSAVLETKPYLLNEQAINMSLSFLTSIPVPVDDLESTKTKITFLSIADRQLVPASSLSTANIIRVDFFQKDIDMLPIYYSNPPLSTLYTLIAGGGKENGQIVEAHYHHNAISKTNTTYPIKTAAEAFKDLQDQKAFISSYLGSSKTIKIKTVSLGYYLGESNQKNLMPIVVFAGDNGFFAYVSAIKDEWITTN